MWFLLGICQLYNVHRYCATYAHDNLQRSSMFLFRIIQSDTKLHWRNRNRRHCSRSRKYYNCGTQKCKRDKDCNDGVCLPNNTCLDIQGVTVRDQISPYFTVGFAPKLKDTCSSKDPVEKCLIECESLFYEWKRALSTDYIPTKTASELGIEDACSGCEGNAIVMPLYLFVNRGSSTIISIPDSGMGMYLRNERNETNLLHRGVSEIHSLRNIFPDPIQADRYGHFVAEDVDSDHPPGIHINGRVDASGNFK